MKVINDRQWFDVKPSRVGGEFYDPDLYIKEFTLEELKKEVKEEWELMTDDEKHFRIINADPTYLSYVLSCVNEKMEETYKVEIDEDNYRFRIIECK